MIRLARKVAAQWGFRQAMAGWNPPIPSWVFSRFGFKEAFAPSDSDQETFQLAKESVNIMLPKLQDLLFRRIGDRYFMNASQRKTEVFYFFAPRAPIDTFSVHLAVRGGRVLLNIGYVPYTLDTNRPDFSKSVEVKGMATDPELAGLSLMRLCRKILSQIA